MSKKNKRSTRSSSARTGESTATVTVSQISQSVQAAPRSSEKAFNPDYSDVIKDLKRIGTLAGTFFVIMIILSFFLK
ncbi:MAG: hypothetical protein DDG59_09520 [Anaerolineae bacterium]|jgi:hypothetical protein|nr:MAG: hypothetical protein DDG59_09520 [Anaerolineae bacterium]